MVRSVCTLQMSPRILVCPKRSSSKEKSTPGLSTIWQKSRIRWRLTTLVVIPASKVIALPHANTQTDRCSRYKKRGDRLLNARTVVNFARPSRFTSSAIAVTFVPERVNRVQVNLPVLLTVHSSDQRVHSSQETARPRVSKRSTRVPRRHRHSEFGPRF